MIYIIFAMNVFGIFTLWKYFRILKNEYYETHAELELQKKKRFDSECKAMIWEQQYRILNSQHEKILSKIRGMDLGPNKGLGNRD